MLAGSPSATVLDVIKPVWWVAVVSLVISLFVTPIVRAAAYHFKIVDRPDDLLKPHARPIAYLGGIAICAGYVLAILASIAVLPKLGEDWSMLKSDLADLRIDNLVKNPLWSLICIAVSSFVMMMVGLLDDLLDIRPRHKVMGQVLAAGILLIGGVGIYMAQPFLKILGITLPVYIVIPMSVIICLFIVVCACNATNLLDGLDGLCGGVTAFISVGFLGLAVWLGMWENFPGTDQIRIVLCLAMAGAVFGFLPYNIHPASIFMGDAGSMLLGFFVATMMAYFCVEGSFRWLMASGVVFALPVLDTALAVVRRLLSHKNIFTGDRSHLYDQLVDRGMTVRQVVGLFYVLTVIAAVMGVALSIYLRTRHALVIYLVLLVIIWTIFYKLGMIHPEEKAPKTKESEPQSEAPAESE